MDRCERVILWSNEDDSSLYEIAKDARLWYATLYPILYREELNHTSEQTILATIDGVNITNESVDAFIANLPKEQRRYASNPLFRKQCLEQIVSVYLYAKMAEEEKMGISNKI